MAIAQFLSGDSNLPSILHSDGTVFRGLTPFGTTRANGLIGNPVDFGVLMAIGTVIPYERLLTKWRGTVAIGAILGIVGVALSGTRTAYVALTASLVILSLLRPSRLWVIAIPAAAAAILAVVLFPPGYFTAPLMNYSTIPAYAGSDQIRINEIGYVITEMERSPVIGNGVGSTLAPDSNGSTVRPITDGYWWAVALEGGIPGLILLFIVPAH